MFWRTVLTLQDPLFHPGKDLILLVELLPLVGYRTVAVFFAAPRFAQLNCHYFEEPAASVALVTAGLPALPLVVPNKKLTFSLELYILHKENVLKLTILNDKLQKM